jgi:hypothetical protein
MDTVDYVTKIADMTKRISDLTEDRDNWKNLAELRGKQREQIAADRAKDLDEAEQRIEQLRTEVEAYKKDSDDCAKAYSRLLDLYNGSSSASGSHITLDLRQKDNVNCPAHYTAGGIDCIDAIESAVAGLPPEQAYSAGAAIKYIWRYSRKNGVEDLQKARWYIGRLIRLLGGER